MHLWAVTHAGSPSPSPFQNHRDLYKTIDQTPLGDILWSSFTLQYNGEKPADDEVPAWMNASFQICYRDPRAVVHDMLGHPDFKDDMDYIPYRKYDPKTQKRQWRDFMSGDWAWIHAVRFFFLFLKLCILYFPLAAQDEIARDPSTHGSTFVPVILGSDKTVVSVATGHTEYWPLYLSIGNVRNSLRRAHKGAVAVIGFLAIPKSKSIHTLSCHSLADILI